MMAAHELVLKLAPVLVAAERLLEDSPESAVHVTIAGLGDFKIDEAYVGQLFSVLFDYIDEVSDGRV
jgi:hypothetical protein